MSTPWVGGSGEAEYHVAAFGLRSCSHSVQAAAHLPLKLKAVRQTAEEAGVPYDAHASTAQ